MHLGKVRTDAQNQQQGMASLHQQLVDVHRKLGILDMEATRLQQAEIGGLKERCKKFEQECVRMERKWPRVHEQLEKIPELERELRASNQKICDAGAETGRTRRFTQSKLPAISGESSINGKTAERRRTVHRTIRAARINQRNSSNPGLDPIPKWRLVLKYSS